MTRHPLLLAFLTAVAGARLVEVLAVPRVLAGAVAAGSALGLLVAVRRRRGVAVASWVLIAAVLGLARAATGPPHAPPTCAVPVGLRGFASSSWRGTIDGPVERRHAGMRTVLLLESELCDGAWRRRKGRVGVTLWDGPEVLRGDRVELELAVEPIAAARNPTDADAVVQARLDGVDAMARVMSRHRLVWREGGLLAAVDVARQAAGEALVARLEAAHAAVARGLVMGDRGGLMAADREAWADAGLAHLLAVSGMHVTMVVLVIGGLVRAIAGRLPGLVERCSLLWVAALACLPAALLFCMWSASPASAVRATLMGSVGLVGAIIGRPARAVEALAFTGLVMLLEQPLILHDAGFMLSMAAVGALLASPRLAVDEAALLARPLLRRILKIRRMLLLGIVASVAATLAALPITTVFFGRVSLVAPLTNLAAVPLGATVATPLALAVVAVAPWAPRLADWLAAPLDLLLGWLLAIVELGAKLPGAAIALATPRSHELALYVAALACCFAATRRRRGRIAAGIACALALLGLAASLGLRGLRSVSSELVVTMPYVGQGDGIIVRFPAGQVGVIDAGGTIATSDWDPGRQIMAPLLRQRGVTRLDLAVVSHAHPDHLGGFAYLAEHFPIAELWRSGQPDEAGELARLEATVAARGGRLRASGDLGAVVEYGGVRIEVIHPRAPGESYFPELGLNDNSVVLRLVHGARSMLFTGDIEGLAEHEIVVGGAPIAADILKVAHHGSRTSSTSEFLEAVRPALAVASCGVHNQFGFPHPEIVDRFGERGVPLLTTAQHGAITLRSDGVTWRVSSHRAGLRLPASANVVAVPDGD